MAFIGRWARAAGRWADAVKDVSPASKEIVMAFNEARDVERGWRAWSDAEHGGKSMASLTWMPRPEGSEDGDEGTMVLEGVLRFDTVRPLLKPTNADGPDGKPVYELPEPIMGKTNFELRLDAVTKNRPPTTPVAVTSATPETRPDADDGKEGSGGGGGGGGHGIGGGLHRQTVGGGGDGANQTSAPHVTKSLKRSGFAGCSTVESPGEFIDLDPYTALRYRVKSDGRKYVVSLRTDNWITDLWQAFLFAPKDRWADIILPRSRFLKTWRGRVMEHHYEMSASRVTGMGIAIAGGGGIEPEGPFRLEVASITGLRLSLEELDMARRKAEAAWGVTAGPDLGLAAQGLRRSLIDVDKEAAAAAEMMKEKTKKSKWVGEMLPSFLGSKGHKEDDEDENEDEGKAGSNQRLKE